MKFLGLLVLFILSFEHAFAGPDDCAVNNYQYPCVGPNGEIRVTPSTFYILERGITLNGNVYKVAQGASANAASAVAYVNPTVDAFGSVQSERIVPVEKDEPRSPSGMQAQGYNPNGVQEVVDIGAQTGKFCKDEGGNLVPDGKYLELSTGRYICEGGNAIPIYDYKTRAEEKAAAAAEESDCGKAYKKTVYDCNTESDNGMMNAVQGLVSVASIATSTSGTDAACSKMASGIAAMNGALAAFQLKCSFGTGDCEDKCKREAEQYKSRAGQASAAQPVAYSVLYEAQARQQIAERNLKLCQRESKTWVGALTNIAQLGMLINSAKKCGKQVQTGLAELCQKNPTFAACQNFKPTDCSDPETARSNTICICQANPRDPRCGYQSESGNNVSGSTNPGNGNGSGGDVNGLDGFASSDGAGTGGAGDVQLGERRPPNYQDANLGKGGGGGGGLSGGGTGSSNGGGGGGGGGYGGDPNILKGYYGGRGGAGGGYGGRGDPRDPQGGGGQGRPGENMDLRKFLPGGQMDPRRGLAGITGPDGITGPNTNIWQKVKTRYYAEQPRLMP